MPPPLNAPLIAQYYYSSFGPYVSTRNLLTSRFEANYQEECTGHNSLVCKYSAMRKHESHNHSFHHLSGITKLLK